jgi:hypothetical protein
MNTIFTNPTRKSLISSSKQHKNKESLPAAGREENMRINMEVNGRNKPP